jgi:hypothetical protein
MKAGETLDLERIRPARRLYSLALANARPDPDFNYFSNANARPSSANAT